MKSKFYLLFVFFLIVLSPFFSQICFAQAQVFPTRLVLNEETPSSYLNLRNSSTKVQKFRIELAHFQMAKDGTQRRVTDAKNPLFEVIKFSPKTVEIQPNDKQVVRVMNTSFETLTDGDYVVYLHFIPESSGSEAPKQDKGSFNLHARIAVAVPVIVRKGTAKLEAKLDSFVATRNAKGDVTISLDLSNRSPYFVNGDLEILADVDGKLTEIERYVGFSSYLPERSFKTSFTKEQIEQRLGPGATVKNLKLRYAANADSAAPFELVLNSNVSLKESSTTAPKKSNTRR